MGTNVHVDLNNQSAILTSSYDYDKLLKFWSYTVQNYNHIVRSRPWYRKCKVCLQFPNNHDDSSHDYVPTWDGRIKLLQRDRVPTGLFLATRKEIEKELGIHFKLDNIKVESPLPSSTSKWISSDGKYEFQNECVTKLADAIKDGRGGLILNATGSGKTRIASMIASRFDCKFLFIVDQLVLLKQSKEEISKHLGEKIGYVGESKYKPRRVTVATIQTLHLHRSDPKFIKWFKHIDVIIVDEIHEALNKSNFNVVHIAKPMATFGLTASLQLRQKPIRLKAYALCGPVIYEYPVQRGMKEGVLSKGFCCQLLFENSLTNIEGWDQAEAYNKKIVLNNERNHLITSLIKTGVRNKHKRKSIIVVVERLRHLEEISKRLENLKIKHKVVSGTYLGESISVKDRFKSKDLFEEGKIKVLVVNKVFKKGISINKVDLIINATGKPSKNDSIQIFGRGVRTHKDKDGLICIDISDTDSQDKNRSKKNWLVKAAKKRISALKQVGITVRKYTNDPDISSSKNSKRILKQCEKWLQKEIKEIKEIKN